MGQKKKEECESRIIFQLFNLYQKTQARFFNYDNWACLLCILCSRIINMAVLRMVCALLSLWWLSVSKTKATTVDVTVPVHPITVGGILAIQCQISNMENDHTVKILRVINGRTEELTTDIRYVSFSLGQRYFVTKRTMTGDNMVYFMTILDISVLDEGKYLCKVYSVAEGEFVTVAEGSTNVAVYYLPDGIYPQCYSTPAITEDMNEDIPLKLTCISARGSPAVVLRWVDNSNQEVSSRSVSQDDTVTSEFDLKISSLLHGSIFICEMTNPGFEDFKRTCHIGPLTVRKPTKNDNTDVLPPRVTIPVTKQNTLTSNDCSSKCTKGNKYTILYLSVATVAAGMLCTVFLITTIIMCCKYHNVSSEARNAQRNVIIDDGSEPVYVSLQRRPEPAIPERRSMYKEPDRSSVCMSVEDPNNPGNKVLMPKEVFEEFYNSLSLKKSDQNRSVVGV